MVRWVRGCRLALAATAVALSTVMLLPAAATAAPPPVMTLTELDAALKSSPDGIVHGYMRTVLKGSTIATVPVEVLAITSDDWGATNVSEALILFEATGPDIDRYGSIVAGMSGSPIYADDGDEGTTDPILGAVSYGDWFTIGGMGLATPIEAMLVIRTQYAAPLSARKLAEPVKVAGRTVDRVIVTSDPTIAKASAADGTLAFRPQSLLSIGGLNPKSKGYKAFAALMEKKGYDVLPLAMPLGVGKDDFETEMVPGAAVGVAASRGDLWIASIGTATYAFPDEVLAFGHPMDWDGPSGYMFTNAWIDGVWPSLERPYKMGRLGAVRGTMTQDRGAAVLGVLGEEPAEATITATVSVPEDGIEASTTTYAARWAMNKSDWAGIAPESAYLAALRACDDYWYAGSARTTTTVEVRDLDDGTTYVLRRANIWDDSYDVPWMMVDDVYYMVAPFGSANENGLAHADILSVDFQAEMDPERQAAEVVDVEAPNGIGWGENRILVHLHEHGVAETQTVECTLTVPAGTALSGMVRVMGGSGSDYMDFEYDDEYYDYYYGSDRRTVKDVVDSVRAQRGNSELSVTYMSMSDDDEEDYYDSAAVRSAAALGSTQTTMATDSFLTGVAYKYVPRLWVKASPKVLPYGGSTRLYGSVSAYSSKTTVDIFLQPADGSAETTVAENVPVEMFDGYEYRARSLRKNGTLVVRFAGDDSYLAAEASVYVRVRAGVRTTSSSYRVRRGRTVTLTSKVMPCATTGKVVFEYYRGGRWRAISRKSLVSSPDAASHARCSWRPPRGTWKVRSRYVGGAVNVSGTSSSRTVRAY